MTLIFNTIGGPCSGKSTLCYGLIALLKARGVEAELVPEYAKELTYRRDWVTISNQFHVTREQDRRLRDLLGQVSVIVHETALPLGLIYRSNDFAEPWFERAVWEMYNGYDNMTCFVRRKKKYQQYGRKQSEAESKVIDQRILDLFGDGKINLTLDGDEGSVEKAYDAVMARLAQNSSR